MHTAFPGLDKSWRSSGSIAYAAMRIGFERAIFVVLLLYVFSAIAIAAAVVIGSSTGALPDDMTRPVSRSARRGSRNLSGVSEQQRGDKDPDHGEGERNLHRSANRESYPRRDPGASGPFPVAVHRQLADERADERADDNSRQAEH
jgi:hypothetical protein